jgi:hypothetical protein
VTPRVQEGLLPRIQKGKGRKRGQEEICCIVSLFCPALLLRKGMPRQVRVEYPGAVYHVMARGNDREKIVRDDEDREWFELALEEVVERTGWVLYA